MSLGTVSICMTVLILNVHHRGPRYRMPPWLRRLCFGYLARILCVRTSYRRNCCPRLNNAVTDSSESARDATAVGAIVVDDEDYDDDDDVIGRGDSVWKRRSQYRTSPSSVNANAARAYAMTSRYSPDDVNNALDPSSAMTSSYVGGLPAEAAVRRCNGTTTTESAALGVAKRRDGCLAMGDEPCCVGE